MARLKPLKPSIASSCPSNSATKLRCSSVQSSFKAMLSGSGKTLKDSETSNKFDLLESQSVRSSRPP